MQHQHINIRGPRLNIANHIRPVGIGNEIQCHLREIPVVRWIRPVMAAGHGCTKSVHLMKQQRHNTAVLCELRVLPSRRSRQATNSGNIFRHASPSSPAKIISRFRSFHYPFRSSENNFLPRSGTPDKGIFLVAFFKPPCYNVSVTRSQTGCQTRSLSPADAGRVPDRLV